MRPTLAIAAIDAVEAPHRGGHTCVDARWYNDNTGTRTPCPVRDHLTTARQQVGKLHTAVHEAAHNDAAATHVAEAMTGLTMADLSDEDRDGWVTAARMAIEGLAEWLDRDPVQESRLAGVRARLARAGIGDPTEGSPA